MLALLVLVPDCPREVMRVPVPTPAVCDRILPSPSGVAGAAVSEEENFLPGLTRLASEKSFSGELKLLDQGHTAGKRQSREV